MYPPSSSSTLGDVEGKLQCEAGGGGDPFVVAESTSPGVTLLVPGTVTFAVASGEGLQGCDDSAAAWITFTVASGMWALASDDLAAALMLR